MAIKVKGLTTSLGGNKDAEDAALSVYNHLKSQGRYNTSLDSIIKGYAINYAHMMRLNRSMERAGGVDVDNIKLMRTLISQANTMTKTLGLLADNGEDDGGEEDYDEDNTVYQIPGL